MTVAEMIKKLQELPQDHEIWSDSNYGTYHAIWVGKTQKDYWQDAVIVWEGE